MVLIPFGGISSGFSASGLTSTAWPGWYQPGASLRVAVPAFLIHQTIGVKGLTRTNHPI